MPFSANRISHLIRRSVLTSVAIAALASVVAVRAHAIEECSDLFLSEYDGLLENRAARADMIYKISRLIPRGEYLVLVDGVLSKRLTVSYSTTGDLEMILGGQRIITNRAVPEVRTREGSVNKTSVRMQLLRDNLLLMTNTIVAGNYETPEGIVRRDLSVEITLDRVHEADSRTITLVTSEATETSSRFSGTHSKKERHTFDVHVHPAPVRLPVEAGVK